ncbi:N-acylneuraminate cytidylyltransferase [Paraliobacillus ryukyuensis]|uniref:N-acylneuraminate cytidylyltransferase/CMP-N,N'-diacetyllegionaminic acid synthase n=1 Tax=Paraliobacillus ryukyuensis TaxID=200904 RepID=A0A366EE94_9BACI|nr:acylneuraminate cytidylyltransferase family protein [Paraliobacillus ryukyuensis]RBP00741.1 N-acylneuraminate cytidylyltransferase/CMP-N,N'-diacetyllegionaminic acid synthase [Paraliobacillus ryukyuensis]
MINNKKVLALIPARGGSKSLPLKNIIDFGGKPLIQWTIDSALQTSYIDKIVVSTDNAEIGKVASQKGVFIQNRPPELSRDDSLIKDTIDYVIDTLQKNGEEFDYFVLLEPTSPLRNVDDIKNCIELIDEYKYDSVATFTEASLNPWRAWEIKQTTANSFIDKANPWLPRQKLPKAYMLNGAVYTTTIDFIRKSEMEIFGGEGGAIIMPKDRSIDVDDKYDLKLARIILEENGVEEKFQIKGE